MNYGWRTLLPKLNLGDKRNDYIRPFTGDLVAAWAERMPLVLNVRTKPVNPLLLFPC